MRATVTMADATASLDMRVIIARLALVLTDAPIMVFALRISHASVILDGPVLTARSMLAHEIALTMDIASMEPAIARRVGMVKLA